MQNDKPSETWLLAATLNLGDGKDSKELLESLGFKVFEKYDFFYRVQPVPGWTQLEEGYWTTVKDENGKTRLMQFSKTAAWDTEVFINLVTW